MYTPPPPGYNRHSSSGTIFLENFELVIETLPFVSKRTNPVPLPFIKQAEWTFTVVQLRYA